MPCKLCQKHIKKHITFKNFFNTDTTLICENCFKLHMNYYPYTVIPINGGLLHVFELLKKETKHPEYFIDYFRPYLKAYMKLNLTIECIYIETLDQQTINLFDLMALGHLIILTNTIKED